jgi:hypothetical protein
MIEFDSPPGYCACGKKCETTGESFHSQTQYMNGEVIYAVCAHGVVLIDKRQRLQPQVILL